MSADKALVLVQIACEIAKNTPNFQESKGAGDGDRATLAFMILLRQRAKDAFGHDFSEQRLCGETGFAADFYFPDEQTVVEIALGLPNPASEFEKDILKVFMSREFGHAVRRLVFVSRAGGIKKCNQPGRAAVRNWAESKHNLTIEIYDLPGEPRIRTRRRTTIENLPETN
jgi:hypothetical protein